MGFGVVVVVGKIRRVKKMSEVIEIGGSLWKDRKDKGGDKVYIVV